MSDTDAILNRARTYPLDRTDDDVALPCPDAAHWAARVLLKDLTDRRGIRQEINEWDDSVQRELVTDLAAIVRSGWGKKEVPEIIEGIVAELSGRSGLDHAFDAIDEDVMEELKETLGQLLVAAYAVEPPC